MSDEVKDSQPVEQEAPDEGAKPAEAMAEAALDSAQVATDSIKANAQAMDLPQFSDGERGHHDESIGIHLLNDVMLNVKIELGRTRMYVEDVLRLNDKSIVELDKAAGDPVDIYVNDRHIARGEVLVLSENFCVRVSEIIAQVGSDD